MSFSKFYRRFIFILCLIGFTYQLTSLIRDYTSGETVVSIRISQSSYDTLPAITICPGGLAFDRVAEIGDNYSKLYDSYLNPIKYEKGGSAKSFFNMQKTMLNDLFEDRLNITEVLRNYTLSYTSLNQTNVEVFLIKVSIPEVVYENFEIIEYDMNEYGTSEIYYGLSYKRTPLETLVYDEEILPRKCLTYFSHLDETGSIWNKSRFSLEQIEFKISFENDSFPYEDFSYPYTLHSPNDLPYIGYGSVRYMMNGYRYFVYYTKVNIKRLGNGFDTKCKDYDKHYIRSDCIWNCYQETMMERQNSSDLFFSGYMMRQEIIVKISHKKFVNPELKRKFRKQSQQILANCSFIINMSSGLLNTPIM